MAVLDEVERLLAARVPGTKKEVTPGSDPTSENQRLVIGNAIWRPTLATRKGVAYLVCRRWRSDTRAADMRRLTQAKLTNDRAYLFTMQSDVERLLAELGICFDTITAPPQSSATDWHFASELARSLRPEAWAQVFVPRKRAIGTSHHPAKARGEMRLEHSSRGESLFIVDDIATSGATLEEAVKLARTTWLSVVSCTWIQGELTRW